MNIAEWIFRMSFAFIRYTATTQHIINPIVFQTPSRYKDRAALSDIIYGHWYKWNWFPSPNGIITFDSNNFPARVECARFHCIHRWLYTHCTQSAIFRLTLLFLPNISSSAEWRSVHSPLLKYILCSMCIQTHFDPRWILPVPCIETQTNVVINGRKWSADLLGARAIVFN